jgi:hypothetical protein
MKIESHADQQHWHYQALKNPSYQIEGMTEILHEEAMMAMPIIPTPERGPTIIQTTNISRYEYEQQKFLIIHLQEKVNQLLSNKNKKLKEDVPF